MLVVRKPREEKREVQDIDREEKKLGKETG